MKTILIDVLPFEFKKSSLTESVADGKLIVTGTLQRAEAKNQNGRVYPKGVLKREAEKYMDWYLRVFGPENFFFEVQPEDQPEDV